MDSLEDDVQAAEAMGLSYGKYKALQYERERKPEPSAPPPPKKVSRKRYTDQAAFELWQQGKSDAQIGAALGVSRQIIQRWRDTLELPSIAKEAIDTKKYHLIETKDGIFIICDI